MNLLERIRYQPAVIAALRRARQSERLAHAYLFWGPEGVGKLRAAMALAQWVRCRASDPPCGVCSDCERIARFTHPDVHVIVVAQRGAGAELRPVLETYARDPYHCLQIPRGAAIGIEQIRSLKVESSMARVERGSRVIILREAERMTPEAAQAALKLIEEPRADTFLVLTSQDPGRLPLTILSRCQRLRFRPLPDAFIEEVLRERAEAGTAEIRLITGLAQGSLSRALALSEGDALSLRDAVVALFETSATDAGEVGQRVLAAAGSWDAERIRRAVDLLMIWYGDLVALRGGRPPETVVNRDQVAELQRQAGERSVGEIRRRMGILEELLEALDHNVNPVLALEASLLRIGRVVEDGPLF